MCLAIYRPAGNDISVDNLRRGWEANDDGAGYCFVDEQGEIIIKKFMNWHDFYETYTPDVERYGNTSPFLIHFRITSKGATNIDNCHPFKVNDDMAIIHNGTMSNIHIDKGDTRSDTKIFAEEYLAGIGEAILDNIFIFNMAEGFVGYSKVCILHRTRGVFILNEDLGHWNTDDGCWYSNKSYEPKKTYVPVVAQTSNYKVNGYADDYNSFYSDDDTYKGGWEYYYNKGKDKVVTGDLKCHWCHSTDNETVTTVTDVLGYENDLCDTCLEEFTELYAEVVCESCGLSAFTNTYSDGEDITDLHTLCADCRDEWAESVTLIPVLGGR